jgi:hypothetical protein
LNAIHPLSQKKPLSCRLLGAMTIAWGNQAAAKIP